MTEPRPDGRAGARVTTTAVTDADSNKEEQRRQAEMFIARNTIVNPRAQLPSAVAARSPAADALRLLMSWNTERARARAQEKLKNQFISEEEYNVIMRRIDELAEDPDRLEIEMEHALARRAGQAVPQGVVDVARGLRRIVTLLQVDDSLLTSEQREVLYALAAQHTSDAAVWRALGVKADEWMFMEMKDKLEYLTSRVEYTLANLAITDTRWSNLTAEQQLALLVGRGSVLQEELQPVFMQTTEFMRRRPDAEDDGYIYARDIPALDRETLDEILERTSDAPTSTAQTSTDADAADANAGNYLMPGRGDPEVVRLQAELVMVPMALIGHMSVHGQTRAARAYIQQLELQLAGLTRQVKLYRDMHSDKGMRMHRAARETLRVMQNTRLVLSLFRDTARGFYPVAPLLVDSVTALNTSAMATAADHGIDIDRLLRIAHEVLEIGSNYDMHAAELSDPVSERNVDGFFQKGLQKTVRQMEFSIYTENMQGFLVQNADVVLRLLHHARQVVHDQFAQLVQEACNLPAAAQSSAPAEAALTLPDGSSAAPIVSVVQALRNILGFTGGEMNMLAAIALQDYAYSASYALPEDRDFSHFPEGTIDKYEKLGEPGREQLRRIVGRLMSRSPSMSLLISLYEARPELVRSSLGAVMCEEIYVAQAPSRWNQATRMQLQNMYHLHDVAVTMANQSLRLDMDLPADDRDADEQEHLDILAELSVIRDAVRVLRGADGDDVETAENALTEAAINQLLIGAQTSAASLATTVTEALRSTDNLKRLVLMTRLFIREKAAALLRSQEPRNAAATTTTEAGTSSMPPHGQSEAVETIVEQDGIEGTAAELTQEQQLRAEQFVLDTERLANRYRRILSKIAATRKAKKTADIEDYESLLEHYESLLEKIVQEYDEIYRVQQLFEFKNERQEQWKTLLAKKRRDLVNMRKHAVRCEADEKKLSNEIAKIEAEQKKFLAKIARYEELVGNAPDLKDGNHDKVLAHQKKIRQLLDDILEDDNSAAAAAAAADDDDDEDGDDGESAGENEQQLAEVENRLNDIIKRDPSLAHALADVIQSWMKTEKNPVRLAVAYQLAAQLNLAADYAAQQHVVLSRLPTPEPEEEEQQQPELSAEEIADNLTQIAQVLQTNLVQREVDVVVVDESDDVRIVAKREAPESLPVAHAKRVHPLLDEEVVVLSDDDDDDGGDDDGDDGGEVRTTKDGVMPLAYDETEEIVMPQGYDETTFEPTNNGVVDVLLRKLASELAEAADAGEFERREWQQSVLDNYTPDFLDMAWKNAYVRDNNDYEVILTTIAANDEFLRQYALRFAGQQNAENVVTERRAQFNHYYRELHQLLTAATVIDNDRTTYLLNLLPSIPAEKYNDIVAALKLIAKK